MKPYDIPFIEDSQINIRDNPGIYGVQALAFGDADINGAKSWEEATRRWGGVPLDQAVDKVKAYYDGLQSGESPKLESGSKSGVHKTLADSTFKSGDIITDKKALMDYHNLLELPENERKQIPCEFSDIQEILGQETGFEIPEELQKALSFDNLKWQALWHKDTKDFLFFGFLQKGKRIPENAAATIRLIRRVADDRRGLTIASDVFRASQLTLAGVKNRRVIGAIYDCNPYETAGEGKLNKMYVSVSDTEWKPPLNYHQESTDRAVIHNIPTKMAERTEPWYDELETPISHFMKGRTDKNPHHKVVRARITWSPYQGGGYIATLVHEGRLDDRLNQFDAGFIASSAVIKQGEPFFGLQHFGKGKTLGSVPFELTKVEHPIVASS